ncbi:MAG: phage tail protein [Opitutales bacterium]|nr:phage tail protein [Opitutales bacterium]MCH8541833.1 phage tail protein [Opitutales bacterium]
MMKQPFTLCYALLSCIALPGSFLSAQTISPGDEVQHFIFEIDEFSQHLPFSEMSGLSSESEIIEQHVVDPDGGETTEKTPGQTQYGNIVMVFPYMDETATFLWNWRQQVVEGDPEASRDATLTGLDGGGEGVVEYNLVNVWPSKWSLDYDTDEEAFVLTIEFAVEEIERESL